MGRGFSSLLRFFGHIIGPPPGAVQHTQDPNGIALNAISDDIRRAANHQFAGSLDAAGRPLCGNRAKVSTCEAMRSSTVAAACGLSASM
jgi:hypothetical protein